MSWDGGYAALSSFGFGGSNVHLLMHGQSGTQSSAARVFSITAEDATLTQDMPEAASTTPVVTTGERIPIAARTPQGIHALTQAIKVGSIKAQRFIVMRANAAGNLIIGVKHLPLQKVGATLASNWHFA